MNENAKRLTSLLRVFEEDNRRAEETGRLSDLDERDLADSAVVSFVEEIGADGLAEAIRGIEEDLLAKVSSLRSPKGDSKMGAPTWVFATAVANFDDGRERFGDVMFRLDSATVIEVFEEDHRDVVVAFEGRAIRVRASFKRLVDALRAGGTHDLREAYNFAEPEEATP